MVRDRRAPVRNWLDCQNPGSAAPGDNLNMWFNPWTKHLHHLQVNTALQGETVQLTATYSTLSNGLNYASYAQVDVPAKQLSVQVQNYNFARLAY